MKRKSAINFAKELLTYIEKETTEFEVVETNGELIASCPCPSEWQGKAKAFQETSKRLKEEFEFSVSDGTELVFRELNQGKLVFKIKNLPNS